MTFVGKDPPSGLGEHNSARPGGVTGGLSIIQGGKAGPEVASDVVATPFGLIRIWEAQGQTFLAETSTDGTLLGPALALAAADAGARAASATVHRLDASFYLTVTWLSGGNIDASGDLLAKSWQLGRGALGLTLTAANDNPLVIGSGAAEATVTALPGQDLLFTWVDGHTGDVNGQLRTALDDASGHTFVLGQSAPEIASGSRRIQVIEVAPLEYAVLWLAANRLGLEGVSLARDVALGEDGGSWATRALPRMPLPSEAVGGLAVARGAAAGVLDIAYVTMDASGAATQVRATMSLAPVGGEAGGPSGVTVPNDFGFQWANQDLLHLAPSALHAPNLAGSPQGPLVTTGDEPVLIDLAAHGAGHGVKIIAVDGTPLETDGPTRMANGWLQARQDGQLTFTPDVDAVGHICLLLTGISETGSAWSRHIDVHVEGLYEAAHVELRNPVKAIPAHAVIAHHAQMAEIGIQGEAPPHGAVSLSGVDADKFVVIGNGLFLRAGTRLEPGRKALEVAVHFKDGLAGAAMAASLVIAVLNEPGAFLSLALPGRAQAAEIGAGQLIAEIGPLEDALGGDRISLALLSNAGGRFALSGGNLVVASPHLFTPDPEATYDVVVRMTHPNGVAIDHKITLHHEDIVGRVPPPSPEKAPAQPVDEKAPPPAAATVEAEAEAAAQAVAMERAAPEQAEDNSGAGEGHVQDAGAGVLPPLHVEAHVPGAKGTSGQPDLGASAGTGRSSEGEGLSKVLAQQQRGEGSGSDRSLGRDGGDGDDNRYDRYDRYDRFDRYEKELVDAMRHASRGGDDRGDRDTDNRGEGHRAEISGDTLFFKPGFGRETIEHVKLSGGEPHDVLDLSLYGTTFEALRAAGAFEQVGNDVVLTLNPADPAHSDQIILKSIELHQIDAGDFKFS